MRADSLLESCDSICEGPMLCKNNKKTNSQKITHCQRTNAAYHINIKLFQSYGSWPHDLLKHTLALPQDRHSDNQTSISAPSWGEHMTQQGRTKQKLSQRKTSSGRVHRPACSYAQFPEGSIDEEATITRQQNKKSHKVVSGKANLSAVQRKKQGMKNITIRWHKHQCHPWKEHKVRDWGLDAQARQS